MKIFWTFILLALATVSLSAAPAAQKPHEPRQVFIGVFEGGDYVLNGPLRDAYRSSLTALIPDSIKAVFVPIGFKSAEWNRDKSRQMARELAANKSVDIVLALGPWSVEDLLAAGFDRPIIAINRFDPSAEGLLGKDGRPIVNNLTVQTRAGKLATDFRSMTSFLRPKKVGFLYFPSDNDSSAIATLADSLGKLNGFEVVTARAYDAKHTFAYFKSFQALPKNIDALYIAPLWGVDAGAIKEFFSEVHRSHIPTFSSDGRPLVERGALASTATQNIFAPARFAAWKTVRIIAGAIPADLPIELPETVGWSVNEPVANELGITIPDNLRMHGYIIAAGVDSTEMLLSLTDAIDRSRQLNPNFLATYDRITAATESASRVKSALLPQLSADASWFYADDNTVTNERDLTTNGRAIGNLRLDWSPFSLVAIDAARIAAKGKDRAQIDQTSTALDLSYAITVAFSAAVHADRAVGAWQEYIRVVNQAADIAVVRSQFESDDRYDLTRLQSEQLLATVALHRAEADRTIAYSLLNSLIGQPADHPLNLSAQNFSERQIARELAGWQVVAPAKPRRDSVGDYLTSIAESDNPRMAVSRNLTDQRQLELSQSKAARLPHLGFSARLSYVDSLANVAGFSEKHVVGRVGATLSFPLFTGSSGHHERSALNAELSAIGYERDNTRLDIARQIYDQMQRLYHQVYSVVTVAQAEPIASEHLDLAFDRFQRVPESADDFLEAAANLRNTRLAILAGEHEYASASASLLRLAGMQIGPRQITPGDALLTRLASKFTLPEDER